jgi:hypothetical protein
MITQFKLPEPIGCFDVVDGNVRNTVVYYDTALPDGHYKLYTAEALRDIHFSEPIASDIRAMIKKIK